MGGVSHSYVWQNGKLLTESYSGTKLEFMYDENGSAFGIIYNGTPYYYVKNLQGDVLFVVDENGSTAASYTYDAWGRILSSTGALANINPIRYRSYYYDSETGFYYLQSRYYDPEICRFINAEDTSLIGANGDFLSYNLFAYCGNNPVAREDAEGDFWITTLTIMAIGGFIGGVISAASSAATQKVMTGTVNKESVLVAAATGFVSGVIAASPLGAFGQQVAGVLSVDCLMVSLAEAELSREFKSSE